MALLESVAPDFYAPAKNAAAGFAHLIDDADHTYLISVFIGGVPLFFALAGWALGGDPRRKFVVGALLLLLTLAFGHLTPFFSLAYLLVPLLALVRFPIKLLVPVAMLAAILAGWGLDALRSGWGGWGERRKHLWTPLCAALVLLATLALLAWILPEASRVALGWGLRAQGLEKGEASQAAQSIVLMERIVFPGLMGFALGGLLLVVGLEERKAWARFGVVVAAGLGLVQLVLVGVSTNATVPNTFYTYRPPVLSQFAGPPGSYRVAPLARYQAALSQSSTQRYLNFQSVPELAQLPESALAAIHDKLLLATGAMSERVEANLNLDIERSLPSYIYDLMIFTAAQRPNHRRVDCLLGRTNVRYEIRSGGWESAGARDMGEIFDGSPKPSHLYENLYVLPRAYVAGASSFATSPFETLRHMADPDFDALGNVILEAKPGGAPALAGAGAAGRVEITEQSPNEVKLEADLVRPGYVVLLERYDANWRATLDGREVPVLRANQIFRAVYAEPGRHVILFRYRQQGLAAGLLISAVTLVALWGVWLRDPRWPAV